MNKLSISINCIYPIDIEGLKLSENLELERGRTIFSGENGAGKTRLFDHIQQETTKALFSRQLTELIFFSPTFEFPRYTSAQLDDFTLETANLFWKKLHRGSFREDFILSFDDQDVFGLDRGWHDTNPGMCDVVAANMSIFMARRKTVDVALPIVIDSFIGDFNPEPAHNIISALEEETHQLILMATPYELNRLGLEPDYEISYDRNISSFRVTIYQRTQPMPTHEHKQ